MSLPTNQQAAADPQSEPRLIDLSGLVAGVRWRRRLWGTLALIGLLLGLAAGTVLPTRSTASADLFVVHENEDSGDGQALMKTDLALLQTTTIAEEALGKLQNGMTPEKFLSTYSGGIVANNILNITARGSNDAEALARVQAVADAFIAVHVKQSTDAAKANADAYAEQRANVQKDLDDLNARVAAATSGADLQSLYDRRGSLSSQIASLTAQVEAASIGSPPVAAGTKILNAPHIASHGFLTGLVIYGGVGFGAGLALGLIFAAVVAVVRDRPILRRDLVAHLGASVVAQIPAPRRFIGKKSAAKERARVTATLARLVNAKPEPVSVLELGSTRAAAELVGALATELATDGPVVVVDDLPGDEMTAALGGGGDVELVAGVDFPQAYTPSDPAPRQLAIATLAPGTAWTDLHRLGAEALVVVRAGRVEATWLHTVARQLADAGIAVIGLVVVHPDPRDKSDGTIWDAVYTAIRGRIAAGDGTPLHAEPVVPVQAVPALAVGPAWPAPVPVRAAAWTNGHGTNGRSGGGVPAELVPAGTGVIQIDSPTMVIPVNGKALRTYSVPNGNGNGANGNGANGNGYNGNGNGAGANGGHGNGNGVNGVNGVNGNGNGAASTSAAVHGTPPSRVTAEPAAPVAPEPTAAAEAAVPTANAESATVAVPAEPATAEPATAAPAAAAPVQADPKPEPSDAAATTSAVDAPTVQVQAKPAQPEQARPEPVTVHRPSPRPRPRPRPRLAGEHPVPTQNPAASDAADGQ